MLKEERQQKILDILSEKSYISVGKLSAMLYVSLPTVRRDLTELEARGMIVRNHGGAMRLEEGAYQIPLEWRSNYKMSEKQQLSRSAAKLIQNGNVIYIDASSSTMHIADFIEAKDITVVTNGLPIASVLASKGIKVILAGGEISPYSLGTYGVNTESELSRFNFDLAFFSSYGVNSAGMIVDTSLEEVYVRLAVFKHSKRKVFLFTKDKYDLDAPYNLIPLDEVDDVITDQI